MAAVAEQWLIFIDTNIFLDFYRLGGESAARQLAALDKHRAAIITCDQVRMEFFKNRQKVIVESLGKIPKPNKLSVPPILLEFPPAKKMSASIDASARLHGQVREKIERILAEPSRNDPLFRAVRRLFERSGPYNLRASDSRFAEFRQRAQDRFALGYPPRKSSDTSFGDAINWEWIVACASAAPSTCHVLIVSRDGDYGVTVGDAAILNDWLKVEFAQRVGGKRKIELTPRLTTALRRLDETVPAEDETAESRLIAELARLSADRAARGEGAQKAGDTASVSTWYDELVFEVAQLQSVGGEGNRNA